MTEIPTASTTGSTPDRPNGYWQNKQPDIREADERRKTKIAQAAEKLRSLPMTKELEDSDIYAEPAPRPKSGRNRSDQARIRRDYEGHLGGGSPRNPLRVPGITHQ